MPWKPASPCRAARCPNRAVNAKGYCAQHLTTYYRQDVQMRGNSASRGYGPEWMKIRAEVLIRAGVPKGEWGLWTVHHSPEYDHSSHPDHRDLYYTLTAMLRTDHSAITGKEHGFKQKRYTYEDRDREGPRIG